MCVLLHLLICTALRAHIIVVETLYKINYYYNVEIGQYSEEKEEEEEKGGGGGGGGEEEEEEEEEEEGGGGGCGGGGGGEEDSIKPQLSLSRGEILVRMQIVFTHRYSPLSSRLGALLSHTQF